MLINSIDAFFAIYSDIIFFLYIEIIFAKKGGGGGGGGIPAFP